MYRTFDTLTVEEVLVTAKVDNFMNKAMVFTREVLVDRTAPLAGQVRIVTSDKLNSTTESVACQVPQTFVEVVVTGFTDHETGIVR